MTKPAFLFPGQGAQSVGMGRTSAEALPAARALFDRANSILGYDLAKVCFEGPAEKLDSTVYSQPALFVTSLAATRIAEGRVARGRRGMQSRRRSEPRRILGTGVCRCDEF